MTEYLTIRPTPAKYIRSGDWIRVEGVTALVRQVYGTTATTTPYGMRPNLPGERLYTIVPDRCAPFTVQGSHCLDVVTERPPTNPMPHGPTVTHIVT